jgi:UDP-3-O-[3-hydroxymyristoyl] glucosamine N-acyltransferase
VIEDDVEIGASAAIERGTFSNTVVGKGTKVGDSVVIGHGTVVGAGSVVTKDLPYNSICAGVPARVIGMRDAV